MARKWKFEALGRSLLKQEEVSHLDFRDHDGQPILAEKGGEPVGGGFGQQSGPASHRLIISNFLNL